MNSEKIDIKISKYIGLNKNKNHFSACFMHVSQKEEVKQLRGDLYTAVSISLPEEFKAGDLINDILDKLEEQYFSTSGGGVLSVLELALKNAYSVYTTFVDDHDITDSSFDLSGIVIWGDVVYIGRIGKAGIYLVRESKVINISETLIEADDYKPLSVASGVFQKNDSFILATPKASATLTNWGHIAQMDESQIEDYIQTLGNTEDIAFLIITITSPLSNALVADEEVFEEVEEIPKNNLEQQESEALTIKNKLKEKKNKIARDYETNPKIDYVKILNKTKIFIVKVLVVVLRGIRKILQILKKKFSQIQK